MQEHRVVSEPDPHFQRRTTTKSLTVADKIRNVNQLLESVVTEYKVNRDLPRAHTVLREVEEAVEVLWDNQETERLVTEEFESREHVCGRFNNDGVIQEVKELYIAERLHEEKIRKVPKFHCKEMSATMTIRRPTGKSQTASPGSLQRRLTESVDSKEGENRGPLEFEDVARSKDNEFKIEFLPANSLTISCKKTEAASPELKADRVEIKEETKEKSPEKASEEIETGRAETGVRQEIDSIIEKIEEEYHESRIDGAYANLEKFKALISTTMSREEHAYYDHVSQKHERLFSDIEDYHKDFKLLVKEIEDDEGYLVENVKKNFTIKYKTVAGQHITMKMEGVVDVPLFNMISLIYEMQGYKKWMPFCQEAKKIKQLTRTSFAGFLKFNMPPPVFDREAFIYGAGFDRLAINGSIFVTAKSIHHNRAFIEKLGIDVPEKSKTTRMDIEYMGGAFYPLGRDKMRVVMVTKLDPKLKFIPLGLLNWIVRKAAQFLLDRLVKKATNLKGTLWEQRIQEDRDFYGFLERKLDEHLANQKEDK